MAAPHTPHTSTAQFDLYAAPQDASKPLIVYVHGGAWRSESKALHAPLAHRIREHLGFPVAIVEYRLSLPETNYRKHPEHAADVLEALQALLSWPDPTVFDRTRLYLIGHSAGAHILTSIFLDSGVSNIKPDDALLHAVQGIAIASGIYDLELLLTKFPSYDFIAQAFTSPYGLWDTTRYSLYEKMNTIRWRIVHSYEDTLVNVGQSDRMYGHLKALYAARDWDEGLITKDYETLTTDHYYVREPIFAKLISDWVKTDMKKHGK